MTSKKEMMNDLKSVRKCVITSEKGVAVFVSKKEIVDAYDRKPERFSYSITDQGTGRWMWID